MGFKKMGRSLDFADFALSSSLEANRSVKFTPLNISGATQFRLKVITVLRNHCIAKGSKRHLTGQV